MYANDEAAVHLDGAVSLARRVRPALVPLLLERLGGSVTVQSNYGEGSTFSVYLPLTVPVGNMNELTTVETTA